MAYIVLAAEASGSELLAMFRLEEVRLFPTLVVYPLLANTASSTIRCCLTLHNKWESGLIDINGLYPGRFLGSQR